MTRRGFTLIEVAIVVAMTAILMLPLLALGVSAYRESEALSRTADLKNDAEAAAARIFRHTAGGFRLDPDNHGLRGADGAAVRWEGDRLLLGSRRLVPHPVADFTATRDGRRLTLHLALRAAVRAGGPEEVRHFFFDREVAP